MPSLSWACNYGFAEGIFGEGTGVAGAQELMAKDRERLIALLDRLRIADGPSFELDNLVFEHVSEGGPFRRYTSGLDSAVALVDEVMPGAGWDVGSPAQPSGGQPWASVWPWGLSERRDENHRIAATPALALLDALVTALVERLPPPLTLSCEIELLKVTAERAPDDE
jgi:hypothetical protein